MSCINPKVPEDIKQTYRECMENHLQELKPLSKESNLPVITCMQSSPKEQSLKDQSIYGSEYFNPHMPSEFEWPRGIDYSLYGIPPAFLPLGALNPYHIKDVEIVHKIYEQEWSDITMNKIEVSNYSGDVRINGILVTIVSYEIIVPNKVMRVQFADNSYEKLVVHKDDKFDLDTGLRIAMAKHAGKKILTQEGIENLSEQLKYYKAIEKIIHKAKVAYRAEARKLEKEQSAALQKEKSNTTKKRKNRLNITKTEHKKA